MTAKQAAEAAGKMQKAYADANTMEHIEFLFEELQRVENQLRGSISTLSESRDITTLSAELDGMSIDYASAKYFTSEIKKRAISRSSKAGEELYSLLDE